MTKDEEERVAATLTGLLAVIDVAMEPELQAQDARVRAARLLLAELEGRDKQAVLDEMDALLPDLLRASAVMRDTPEAREVLKRVDATRPLDKAGP